MEESTSSRDVNGSDASRLTTFLALSQGPFYVLTGIWPVVSIRTFQMVTGRKRDLWLVKTAGLLIAVIGSVLTLAGIRGRQEPEVPILATGTAVSLAGIDVVYVRRGTIPRIYLLDALMEVALALGWVAVWIGKRGTRPPRFH